MIYSMLYLLLLMQMLFIRSGSSQNAVYYEARLSNAETESYVTSYQQRPGSPVATVKMTTPGEYPKNSTIWAYFPQDSERTVIFASQFWDTFISVYGDPDIGTRLLWTASPWPWQIEDNVDGDAGSRLIFVRSAYDTLYWTSNPYDPRFIGIQPKGGRITPHIGWILKRVGEGESEHAAGVSADSPPVRRPSSGQSPGGRPPVVVQPPQGHLVRPIDKDH